MDLETLYIFFSNPIVLSILAAIGVLLTIIALYLRLFVLTEGQRNLKSYACRYPDDKDKVILNHSSFFPFISIQSLNDSSS